MTLQYRTFESLLSEVQYEFKRYYLEDQINPQDFIKVAKRCNYELGLKVFSTKEDILDVENGRVRLPLNFNVMNFAFVLGDYTSTKALISGTHVEDVIVSPNYNPGIDTIDTCSNNVGIGENDIVHGVHLNCKGEHIALVQKLKYETKTWQEFYRIRFKESSGLIDFDCPNKLWQSNNSAYIKDGFVFTSFKRGKLYINYQAMLENEDGELLVPDHDLLNEFYEYAIKQRVLENLIMNGEPINANQIQIIEQRYKAARNNAMSLVNTPDFAELKAIWDTNRKAQYSNYYHMFQK